MAELEPDERPTPYRLSSEPPPKRRYQPMKGFRASSEREPDEFDKPVLKRFFGSDPFPWALAVCVLLWVGLALAARREPVFGIGLIAAGFLACILSQVWIFLSLYGEDPLGAVASVFSDLYRSYLLYTNADLIWRPMVLTFVGILMILTGMAMSFTRAMGD